MGRASFGLLTATLLAATAALADPPAPEPGAGAWDHRGMRSAYRSLLSVETEAPELRGASRYQVLQSGATEPEAPAAPVWSQRQWQMGSANDTPAVSRSRAPSLGGLAPRSSLGSRHSGSPGSSSLRARSVRRR